MLVFASFLFYFKKKLIKLPIYLLGTNYNLQGKTVERKRWIKACIDLNILKDWEFFSEKINEMVDDKIINEMLTILYRVIKIHVSLSNTNDLNLDDLLGKLIPFAIKCEQANKCEIVGKILMTVTIIDDLSSYNIMKTVNILNQNPGKLINLLFVFRFLVNHWLNWQHV